MKPLTLSFSTFLKICAKKPRGKIGEIKRFTKQGGYDFYKKLKLLSGQIARNEITLSQAIEIADGITRTPERTHTIAALKRVHPLLKALNLPWEPPPQRTFETDSKLLKIKLTPDLAFRLADGKIQYLYLWNLARPELSQALAGEGLWLLVDELGKPNNAFGILNLRTERTHGEELIAAASGLQLKHDLKTIEAIWRDVNDPSLSYEETLSHITSLPPPP